VVPKTCNQLRVKPNGLYALLDLAEKVTPGDVEDGVARPLGRGWTLR
jgi:hypothetical protein